MLLGTAGTWFLFDITFYGNGLFKETVFIILGLSGQGSDEDKLFRTAVSSLIIAVLSIPGYWVSVFLIDKWGRKPIQFLGTLIWKIYCTRVDVAPNLRKNESTREFFESAMLAAFYLF